MPAPFVNINFALDNSAISLADGSKPWLSVFRLVNDLTSNLSPAICLARLYIGKNDV